VDEALWGEFEVGGMEMFVLSGIMIVTGLTLVIVFNATILTTLFANQQRGARRYFPALLLTVLAVLASVAGFAFGDAGDGLGQLGYLAAVFFGLFAVLAFAAVAVGRVAPAFKMSVAYPLANRFRTGMTISMFAIVVFSITLMGIINGSFLEMFTGDEGRGGWDVLAVTNENNPIDDMAATLSESGFDATAIEAAGRVTTFDDNAQEARVPGGEWDAFPIIAGDEAFYASARMALQGRAMGYTTDRAVYDAVASQPGLALVDASTLQASGFGGDLGLTIDGVEIRDGVFEPFQVEVRDAVTGTSMTLTVVGVLSAEIPTNLFFGLYVNEQTFQAVLGEPDYRAHLLRLQAPGQAPEVARAVEAALVTRGVQAVSVQEEIDEVVSSSLGFLRLFQAFMAMGLVVGIAALGVIALRSVVERRQQIGMLRAIGYQRGTVALSFLLESSFIAMMGIFAGVIGATLLGYRLITDNAFAEGADVPFFIPWNDIAFEVGVAFVFALLMTWLPSRRAAAVPIAEALRYE
jgi:putative ABC transport system permease protein